MRYVRFSELATYSIPWSRVHIRRLVAAGKFPAPVNVDANTIAWPEDEILAFLEQRRRERDMGSPRRRRRSDDAA